MVALRWLLILGIAGSVEDGARSAAIVGQLATTQDGRAVIARVGQLPRIYFGAPATPGVLEGDTIVLDTQLSPPRAAARVGHLLLHRAEGLPGEPPADARACAAWLRAARGAEERADAMERRILRDLGTSEGEPSDLEKIVAEYAARCPRAASRTSSDLPL